MATAMLILDSVTLTGAAAALAVAVKRGNTNAALGWACAVLGWAVVVINRVA